MCILFKTQTPGHRVTPIPRQKKVQRIWECKISRKLEIQGQEDIKWSKPNLRWLHSTPPQGDTNPPPKKRLKECSKSTSRESRIESQEWHKLAVSSAERSTTATQPTNEIDEKLFGHPRLKRRNKDSRGHLNPEVQPKPERTTKLNKSGKLHESVKSQLTLQNTHTHTHTNPWPGNLLRKPTKKSVWWSSLPPWRDLLPIHESPILFLHNKTCTLSLFLRQWVRILHFCKCDPAIPGLISGWAPKSSRRTLSTSGPSPGLRRVRWRRPDIWHPELPGTGRIGRWYTEGIEIVGV